MAEDENGSDNSQFTGSTINLQDLEWWWKQKVLLKDHLSDCLSHYLFLRWSCTFSQCLHWFLSLTNLRKSLLSCLIHEVRIILCSIQIANMTKNNAHFNFDHVTCLIFQKFSMICEHINDKWQWTSLICLLTRINTIDLWKINCLSWLSWTVCIKSDLTLIYLPDSPL